MSFVAAKGLYDVAIKRGAKPGEWFGVLDPVPRDKWLSLQEYFEGTWTEIAPDVVERIRLE